MPKHPVSLETRAKIANSLRGRTVPPEVRKRISEGQRGRVMSPETRAKISTKLKGRPVTWVSSLKGQTVAGAETLQRLYWGEHLTLDQIGEQLGCSGTGVLRAMVTLGIPRRTSAESLKLTGKANPGCFPKGLVPWNKSRHTGNYGNGFKKEQTAWNKGIPMREWMPEDSNADRKEKIRQTLKRRYIESPEFREELIKARVRLKDPAVKEKMVKATRLALFKRPNKPEQRVIDIIIKYKLPYSYTGGGSVILLGLNPDFVNCNGAKKIIEVFGIVYHNPDKTFLPQVPLIQQEPYRKALYASLGFDCLVLWDDEMKKLSDEEIMERIKEFTRQRKKPKAQLQFKGTE